MRSVPLLRPALLHALLMLCTLGLLFGCEEAAGGPKVSFENLFEPDEAVVERGAGETRVRMLEVKFGNGSDDLSASSKPSLDKFAEVFEQMPGARITIEGHTDTQGNAAFNLQLSQSRADAVRDYLVNELGAPPVVFTTIGYGEDQPIADNSTRVGRALNRRIEIIVDDASRGPVFHVSLRVERLTVEVDCDDITGSASAEAGDFFMQTEFFSESDRGFVLVDRTANTLVQLNNGEERELEIAAEGLFLTLDDAVLNGYIDWYENDSDDRQFDFTEELRFRYIASERCWSDLEQAIDVLEGGDQSVNCTAPEGGEIATGTLSIDQPGSANVDECVADLDWSLVVERIDR